MSPGLKCWYANTPLILTALGGEIDTVVARLSDLIFHCRRFFPALAEFAPPASRRLRNPGRAASGASAYTRNSHAVALAALRSSSTRRNKKPRERTLSDTHRSLSLSQLSAAPTAQSKASFLAPPFVLSCTCRHRADHYRPARGPLGDAGVTHRLERTINPGLRNQRRMPDAVRPEPSQRQFQIESRAQERRSEAIVSAQHPR